MLRLNAEQFELLEQLTVSRHARSVAGVLAQAWPAVTERLQDRWPAFVEAAMQQARRHGIGDAVDLAHYTGLWCLWGASFEDKPAFAWAREILDDPRRTPPLKLHQLVQHTRGDLAQRQPQSAASASGVTLAQFDAAVALVDAQAREAAARVVFPPEQPPARIQACDLGTVDLMVADIEVQAYRLEGGQWQRQPAAMPAPTREHFDRAPEAPLDYAVLSHALRRGSAARLNLKLAALAVCNPRVHPQVMHAAPSGRLTWKGRDAAQLSIALNASAPEDDALPGIAAVPAPDPHTVAVSSCGLRDAGAPFGALSVGVRVYPATQWLVDLQHPAWPAMQWPVVPAPPEAPPLIACHLEADGVKCDAAALQRAWGGLRASFGQGMDKLFSAWCRVVAPPGTGAQAPKLDVRAECLAGRGAATWGYVKTGAATVAMRTEGAIDMTAFSIDLQLTGELAVGATRSRVRLFAQDRHELRMSLRQLGEEAAEDESLDAAVRKFRIPFTIEIDPIATTEPATAGVAATVPQVLGALAGECGLRPRADGRGRQWFFTLRVEPCSVALLLCDPVVGNAVATRALLPGLPLVDWSAG